MRKSFPNLEILIIGEKLNLLEVCLCCAEQTLRLEKRILDKEVAFVNTEVHSHLDSSICIEQIDLCVCVCSAMSFNGYYGLGWMHYSLEPLVPLVSLVTFLSHW